MKPTSNKTKTIAVDIDDVLADSTENFRQVVNGATGANLSREDYMVSGDYSGYYERVWRDHGLTDISYDDFEAEMIEDQMHVPLLAGASFAIKELSRQFHIVLITARPSSWEIATKAWLKAHFEGLDLGIYFTKSHPEAELKAKGKICKELDVEWLIDDNPVHCQSALDHGIKAVLFGEYGWHHNFPENLKRCKTWPEVLEYFDEQS